MSTDPTPYQAKDGLYYSSYVEQRDANIRQNKLKLAAKGLDADSIRRGMNKFKKKKTTIATADPPRRASRRRSKVAATKRLAAVGTQQRRRRTSARIRNAPPKHSGLLLDEPVTIVHAPRRKRRRVINANGESSMAALSDSERTRLRRETDWLDAMEAYLKDEEGLSYPNQRSVMRQVEKLVSGHGITYARWEDGVSFYKNKRLDLAADLGVVYDEAVDFEDEHGKDLGNGWLLRHPIKKLANFQRYTLEQQGTSKRS